MLSYIIPTHNRHDEFATTLERLASINPAAYETVGGAEIIIADNASTTPVAAPDTIASVPTRVIRLDENFAAAGRNHAANDATATGNDDWLVMLDDDSAPLDANFIDELTAAPDDVAAIAADITLPSGIRESGGLPEVWVGCGVAIRRHAFLELGGYDPTFGYYAEEYDLAAKCIAAGYRIVHSLAFRVLHRKVTAGRDFNQIIRRLVRNNGVVIHRYAPDSERAWMLQHTLDRYAVIAQKEMSTRGYHQGVADLDASVAACARCALEKHAWARFCGTAAAEQHLRRAHEAGLRYATLVRRGKHDWAVERALERVGVEITPDREGGPCVVATLSPGPMLDGARSERVAGRYGRVITPWTPEKSLANRPIGEAAA